MDIRVSTTRAYCYMLEDESVLWGCMGGGEVPKVSKHLLYLPLITH